MYILYIFNLPNYLTCSLKDTLLLCQLLGIVQLFFGQLPCLWGVTQFTMTADAFINKFEEFWKKRKKSRKTNCVINNNTLTVFFCCLTFDRIFLDLFLLLCETVIILVLRLLLFLLVDRLVDLVLVSDGRPAREGTWGKLSTSKNKASFWHQSRVLMTLTCHTVLKCWNCPNKNFPTIYDT